MATYKLIQDVEAEDHILGPLTLREFIYGLVAALFYYLSFLVVSKHVGFFIVLFLPPALFATFFAYPFKRDQPTEVWALAKLGFLLKPRRRLWSQSGVKDTVTITAPKKIEANPTRNLSKNEVQHRLQSLALMLDSRGWAVKNMPEKPDQLESVNESNERLIAPGSLPKPVPEYETTPSEDMLDEYNPQLKQISDMETQKSQERRQRLLNSLSQIREEEQIKQTTPGINEVKVNEALKARAKNSNLTTSNMHHISSLKTEAVTPEASAEQPKMVQTPKTTIEPRIDRARLSYGLSNPGLSIQTLSHELNREGPDEVVVQIPR